MNLRSDFGMLTEMDRFPPELLDCPPTALHNHLPGPTLVHLPGRREPALFVSVLLHGNEPTGLLAVQALLKRYWDQELPRSLSIFLGNVRAAREGLRRLDGQPDYNRIWPGAGVFEFPEAQMMQQIVDTIAARGVFASVDIHNNTGINPHYACVNKLNHRFLQLANLFSRTVVYFIRPRGVQSMALAKHCPAVTLECGKPGEARGLAHAIEYLDACLHLSEIPHHRVAEHDIELFHTMAQVRMRETASFSFDHRDVDVVFDGDIDRLNFRELPAGTTLGKLRDNTKSVLLAIDEEGQDATTRYFENSDQRLTLIRPAMPSMLTLDERVIRQDCLCYLMERLRVDEVL